MPVASASCGTVGSSALVACNRCRAARSMRSCSLVATGSRTVRTSSALPRWTAWRIHHTAYVENFRPRWWSNFWTARISPRLPSCTRSSRATPGVRCPRATLTTSRRLAATMRAIARSPSSTSIARSAPSASLLAPSSRCLASTPTSIARASSTSSAAVSRLQPPISFRYAASRSSFGAPPVPRRRCGCGTVGGTVAGTVGLPFRRRARSPPLIPAVREGSRSICGLVAAVPTAPSPQPGRARGGYGQGRVAPMARSRRARRCCSSATSSPNMRL